MLLQSYIPECNCARAGIIYLPEGVAACRWCYIPYSKGSVVSYSGSLATEPTDGVVCSNGVKVWFNKPFYRVDENMNAFCNTITKNMSQSEIKELTRGDIFETPAQANNFLINNSRVLSIHDVAEAILKTVGNPGTIIFYLHHDAKNRAKLIKE